eukprot:5703389-Prymnesium_polylepis.1
MACSHGGARRVPGVRACSRREMPRWTTRLRQSAGQPHAELHLPYEGRGHAILGKGHAILGKSHAILGRGHAILGEGPCHIRGGP